MSMWDSVIASASKAVTQAATQAGEVTAVVATKAKLSADLLVIDRDVNARMERFGVEMYAHLEGITSTQEFYVADDRLINIIRPTLIRAQREVAAYERKRDAMRGKVNLAEAERCGTGSIIYASTIGEKLYNAAKFAAAGAKEAANKTELAMLERQILGFKEEFGTRLYPIFASLEDDEGWLPTDRKVRSLYDGAREDIAKMEKAREEKREQIRRLDAGGSTEDANGTGFAPPPQTTVASASKIHSSSTPTAVATPIPSSQQHQQMMMMGVGGQMGYGSSGYGLSQAPSPPPVQTEPYAMQQHQPPHSHNYNSGFGFVQTAQQPQAQQQHQHTPMSTYHPQQQQQQQQQPPARQNNVTANIFDPFDSISIAAATTMPYKNTASTTAAPDWFDSTQMAILRGNNTQTNNNGGGVNQMSSTLSDADMNLFKY
ncbi:hypothetical protein ACHAXA_003505 [Cyclostephanos tholiformis]|uniref:Uncharacterized protein n=1 Tax=Cyclostephanos tholiformis TaxID=382380 RepID=A0ABD3SFN8_9STRA